MGTDKALLSFGKETLLERALRTAGAVANTVFIVGPRERYAQYGDVVEDVFPDCGPLGGIHAALCITQTELNLMLVGGYAVNEFRFSRLAAGHRRVQAVS